MAALVRMPDVDMRELFAICRASMREHIEAARGESWNEQRELEQFRSQLDARAVELILEGATLTGFVDVRAATNHLLAHTMVIRPEMRGRGIGSEVLAQILARARSGGRLVRLSVLKANPRARDFYGRLGFRLKSTSEYHDHLVWDGR